MTVTGDVITGVAQLLDAAGIATWRPTGAYLAGETAITVGLLPPRPARALALTVYGSSDDPHLADSLVQLQVRTRGSSDPRDVDVLADLVFDELHGRTGFDLDGVPVIEAHRESWASLGIDENGRWERSDNYYLQTHNPTQYRQF